MRAPRPVVLAVVGVLAAAAVVAVLVAGGDDPDAGAAPPTTPPPAEPTADPTPDVTPEPEPEPTPEPAEPFEVGLVEADGLHVVSTDNAPIVSRAPLEPDAEVADRAAEIARAALEDFLNTQFTDAGTWFGPGAIEALLTPRALAVLTDEDRAALGHLDLDVERVVTGEAGADPMITMLGERPRNVTLEFWANFTVFTGDGEERPMRLGGAMVFLPTEDGWLVEAVDAELVEETGT